MMTLWACASDRWSKHVTISFQTSVFHTFLSSCPEEGSTPQVPLLPAPSHQCLLWWDAGAGRCSWGHGWTSSLPLCQPLPSVTSASPYVFFNDMMVDLRASLQSSAKRLLNMSMMTSILSLYDWASTGFCGPESGKSSGSSSGTLMISTCFEVMLIFRNLPKEEATLGCYFQKQGKLWCFWCETPAYIVPMTLIWSLTPG